MEIGLSDDQQLFRDTTRKMLEQRCPITRVRELIDDPVGFDRSTWKQGGDLGWYAMLVPEEHGGGSLSGEPLVDATIVAEELGRLLHPGPFHATNVVAFALAESGSAAQKEQYLPAMVTGDVIGTWAFAEPNAGWAAASVALAARPSGSGFVLDGTKALVQDAHVADVLLVTARAPQGLTQFVVDRTTPGVTVEPLEALDLSRRLSNVRFEGVEVGAGALVGNPGDAAAAIERQLQVALVLQCADANGATDWALATTVQYAKDRVAFGRPIGSYQALKHRMADHRMWLEGGFASTAYAARSVQRRDGEASLTARIAKAQVGKWSNVIIHDCIQIHGGIAMTFEFDMHLYFRRTITDEVLYGSPAEQCRSLVDLVEGAA